MKRDYFLEIEELRSRNPQRKGVFGAATQRLDPLSMCTRALKTRKRLTVMQRELLRYAPVGAVAVMEGYVKGLIRELVDAGHPFVENVVNLKRIDLTVENLVGLQSGKATLGEFVSHFVSVSCLEDVDKVLSAILGFEFFKALKAGEGDLTDCMQGVARAFELRHIIAHELAPNLRVSAAEADECVMYVFLLLMLTQLFLQEYLEEL